MDFIGLYVGALACLLDLVLDDIYRLIHKNGDRNKTENGGDDMSMKELNKMLEKLPEANLEDLELVVKGMLLAQKAQKRTGDKQSA